MESNIINIIDDDGTEKEMEILFTFEDDNSNKSYVLFTDPNDVNGEVFVCSYDDDGVLNTVEDEDEFSMIEEVFNTFMEEIDHNSNE